MSTPILKSEMNQVNQSLEDGYLKFYLQPQTPAVLAMDQVQEVLVVTPRRITPMPNMPEYVLGLLNRRNRVLWVIDLAKMFNFQHFYQNHQQYNLVIIKAGQFPLGLLVQEIKGVRRYKSSLIQAATGVVTPLLIPYLNGCIFQQEEVALVLNAEAIVHSRLLSSNWLGQ